MLPSAGFTTRLCGASPSSSRRRVGPSASSTGHDLEFYVRCLREWLRLVSGRGYGRECSGKPQDTCSSSLERSIVQIGLETTELLDKETRIAPVVRSAGRFGERRLGSVSLEDETVDVARVLSSTTALLAFVNAFVLRAVTNLSFDALDAVFSGVGGLVTAVARDSASVCQPQYRFALLYS